MNLKKLAKSLEIGEEECLELLNLFIKTAASELRNLESALKKKDAPFVERMAHSIKGGAGILGLLEIHDTAKRIEMAARGNHLEDIGEDIRTLGAKLDLIAESLIG
ncbi:MAG: Hpt domain-containing protein [Thermodesulfobacteriota bacterium]|nr:Hpt domain-containing protein [Thermodesulfobacteriota bacterium]